MAEPNIYQYDSYRQYLGDWFLARSSKKRFSQRAFAKKAGFKTHNILQLVTRGERNLTLKSIVKFAAGLGLNDEEHRYFAALVKMDQAASERERSTAYSELCSFPGRRRARPIEKHLLAFFQSWLAPVIYEMVQFPDFKPDVDWLLDRLPGTPKPAEIRRILESLVASGLIEVDGRGRWNPRAEIVFSGNNVRDVALFAYHQVALEKAADALETVPTKLRQFNVLTSAVPKSAVPELLALAAKFESEFWSCVERQTGIRDEVVQCSFQIFSCIDGFASSSKEKP